MFIITHTDGRARTGVLHTAHGEVETPFFMPVASKGSVKAMEGSDLDKLGFQSIITNSFIMSLSPGIDVIQGAGGIHKFMQFSRTIFTDSGGFQVLSKDFMVKKSEEGVIFKDKQGKKNMFTPEISVENQMKLGSDIAMTLDDVAHYGMNGKDYVDAIRRTHNWAKRSLLHHKKLKNEAGSEQLIFGICQGGTKEEYRRFSTYKINELPFDGVALGGLVIGESRKELMKNVQTAVTHFDDNKIKYLMGLGSPPDIVQAVGEGVDCFDSIYPTSNARHGSLLTKKGRFDVKKIKYKHDYTPIEEGCACETCKKYSKAYVHHLLRTHELLGYKLATTHNLHFMHNLIRELRLAIKEQRYKEYAAEFLKEYFSGKEKEEFSNHIQQKYLEKKKQNTTIYQLPWYNEYIDNV